MVGASFGFLLFTCILGSAFVEAHSNGFCLRVDPCTGNGQIAVGMTHSLSELGSLYSSSPCTGNPSVPCTDAVLMVDMTEFIPFTNAVNDAGGIPDAPGWSTEDCINCLSGGATLSWSLATVTLDPGDHSITVVPSSVFDYFAYPEAACFPVNVQMPTAFAISCPGPQVVYQTAYPDCSAVATFSDATCAEQFSCPSNTCSVDRVAGQASSTSFPVGNTFVEWALEVDSVPTGQTCSHLVEVIDNNPPTVVCGSAITVSCTSASGASVLIPAAVVNDCQSFSETQSHMSGDTFPIGTTDVTFTATDSSLNTAMCSTAVTVTSVPAAIQNCPTDLLVTDDSIVDGEAVVSWTEPTATDGCLGSLAITRVAGPASGSTFNVTTDNPTTITYRTAVDPVSGQQLECSFVVSFLAGRYARVVSISQLDVDFATELAMYVPFTVNTEFVNGLPVSAVGRLWLSDGTHTVNIATIDQSLTFNTGSLTNTFIGAHGLTPGPVTLSVTVVGQPFDFYNQLPLTLVTGNVLP